MSENKQRINLPKQYLSLADEQNATLYPVNYRLLSEMPVAPTVQFTAPCSLLQTEARLVITGKINDKFVKS
jgi:hypothetical protein